MNWQPHHHRDFERARDHLTNAIIHLESATERMISDDWLETVELREQLRTVIAPKLSELRARAQERFAAHHDSEHSEDYRTGRRQYPDQRPEVEPVRTPVVAVSGGCDAPVLEAPNAKRGEVLVATHGGVLNALRARRSARDSDDICAYHYLVTGERIGDWTPPVANPNQGTLS